MGEKVRFLCTPVCLTEMQMCLPVSFDSSYILHVPSARLGTCLTCSRAVSVLTIFVVFQCVPFQVVLVFHVLYTVFELHKLEQGATDACSIVCEAVMFLSCWERVAPQAGTKDPCWAEL